MKCRWVPSLAVVGYVQNTHSAFRAGLTLWMPKTLSVDKIVSFGKWPSRQKPGANSQQRAWSSDGAVPTTNWACIFHTIQHFTLKEVNPRVDEPQGYSHSRNTCVHSIHIENTKHHTVGAVAKKEAWPSTFPHGLGSVSELGWNP